jgi:hypothetical protein
VFSYGSGIDQMAVSLDQEINRDWINRPSAAMLSISSSGGTDNRSSAWPLRKFIINISSWICGSFLSENIGDKSHIPHTESRTRDHQVKQRFFRMPFNCPLAAPNVLRQKFPAWLVQECCVIINECSTYFKYAEG